jgi:hypothetical protein
MKFTLVLLVSLCVYATTDAIFLGRGLRGGLGLGLGGIGIGRFGLGFGGLLGPGLLGLGALGPFGPLALAGIGKRDVGGKI